MPSVDVPPEFICPITNSIMQDPVMDREGNTYERAAVLKWLERSSTSPITRSPLTSSDLVPNRNLKESIEAFAVAHTGADLLVPRKQTPATGPQPAEVALKFWQNPQGECLLTIEPPAGDPSTRAAVDVVCVIDVSGSMGEGATIQNEKKETESHGLSLLDVVKHAARTVSQLLSAGDRLAIVTFSNNAEVKLPLTIMTADGKARAGSVLDSLEESGQTNLWDGLQTAMDLLKNDTTGSDRSKSVLLLTDGCPNVEPPRGHLPTMKQYIDRLGGVAPFTVNTFGFGYNLDSVVLNDLAREGGGGMYVFIPDSGLVGTVFVNCVANLLATLSSSVSVSIESDAPITDALNLSPTRFGAFGSIGGLQYGQTRDVYFRAVGASRASLFAKVEYSVGGVTKTATATAELAGPLQSPLFCAHNARNQFCAGVLASFKSADKAPAADLAKKLLPIADTHPLIKAIVADLTGEVALAFATKDNFSKWGRHYLPSLVRANELQQCNNFKDKSVQQYGSAFFAAVRDQGEAIFIKLPPPVSKKPVKINAPPSRGGSGPQGRGRGVPTSAVARPPAPVQMTAYYNCGGGCVAPDSLVALADGAAKRAHEVRKGDVLLGGARVVCAVRIESPKDGLEMVTVKGGLVISPYHPIRLGGEWVFPTECSALMERRNRPDLRCIYNFVLDTHHVATVDGVEVCTFGHGFQESEVIRHEFFGTQAVVSALSGLSGYGEGQVTVTRFLRSPSTNRVCGLEGI